MKNHGHQLKCFSKEFSLQNLLFCNSVSVNLLLLLQSNDMIHPGSLRFP